MTSWFTQTGNASRPEMAPPASHPPVSVTEPGRSGAGKPEAAPLLNGDFKIISGNSNTVLARRICDYLERPLSKADVGRFSDGEIQVEIGENVRGLDTFIIKPRCPPVNDLLVELLIMCDALKRASAASINAVIPYYGYARRDRTVARRTPITAKLVADLLEVAGATRVLSMDMHVGQIQGFFNIPSDHLYASPLFVEDIKERFGTGEDVVIVSPDAGGVERARAYSKRLSSGRAIVAKRRSMPNAAEVMNPIAASTRPPRLLLTA